MRSAIKTFWKPPVPPVKTHHCDVLGCDKPVTTILKSDRAEFLACDLHTTEVNERFRLAMKKRPPSAYGRTPKEASKDWQERKKKLEESAALYDSEQKADREFRLQRITPLNFEED